MFGGVQLRLWRVRARSVEEKERAGHLVQHFRWEGRSFGRPWIERVKGVKGGKGGWGLWLFVTLMFALVKSVFISRLELLLHKLKHKILYPSLTPLE